MNKKFTKLMAALALLVFMAPNMVGWGQTTVTQTSFTALSGNVNDDPEVSYASYKGGGTSDPAINSNAIRLYQNANGQTGGYVVIGVTTGYQITSATIQSTMATTTGYKLTDSDPGSTTPSKNTFNVSNYSLSANTDYTVSNISTQYITFACFGTSSSSRLYLSKISVTYESTSGGSTTYTVTFDCDGGTGCPEDITGIEEGDDNFTVPSVAPTKEHYGFDGFYIGSDDEMYEPGETYTIESDLELTASWTINKNDVTLNDDNTDAELYAEYGVNLLVEGETVAINYGTELVLGADNLPANHTVVWTVKNISNVDVTADVLSETTVTVPDYAIIIMGTVTEIPTYTINFIAGSGTCETESSSGLEGSNITLPEAQPSQACASRGWTFAGWATASVNETTTVPTLYNGTYTITTNVDLYAVYTVEAEGNPPTAFSVGNTGTYAIVSEMQEDNKYYALPTKPTVNSGKIAAQEITVSEMDGVKYIATSDASGFAWTIASATNGYTLSDGSKYIYHSNGGSSGTNLAYGNSTSYTWSFTAVDGCIKMAGMNGSTTGSRGMLFSGTDIGGYSLTNWNTSGYYKTMILPVADATVAIYATSPDCLEKVATPVIALAEGTYTEVKTTTITCATEGATIYYTTDGTDPTDESTEYTGAITIGQSMTLKAIAVKENMENSNIASATYTINIQYTLTINNENGNIRDIHVFDDPTGIEPILYIDGYSGEELTEASIDAGTVIYVSVGGVVDCKVFDALTVTCGGSPVTPSYDGDMYSFTLNGNTNIAVSATDAEEYTLTVAGLEHVSFDLLVGSESDITSLDANHQATVCEQVLVEVIGLTVGNGFSLQSVTLAYGGETQTITPNEYGVYAFNMPSSNATLTFTTAPITAPYYALYSGALTEGDYLIVYNGKAMKNSVTSNRLDYIEVTAINDIICADNSIIWHIAPSGDYWTIYNAAVEKYAAGNGTKNQAALLDSGTDNGSLWTASGTSSYEFVNKKNAASNVNSNLRNNGTYGFACYASSTGGALSLYKKVTPETYTTMEIQPNQWYFIASPTGTSPTNVEALSDLYYYDEQDHHWRNQKVFANSEGFVNFDLGKGYLCANTGESAVTLTFTGVAITANSYSVDLEYHANTSEGVENTLAGWNLVGNPFTSEAYIVRDYYVIGNDATTGKSIIVASEGGAIAPYTGVMVQAEGEGESVTFTTNAPENPSNGNLQMTVAQQVVTRDGVSTGSTTIDNAIVSFNEGSRLGKFYFGENDANIYIPQNGKEYAIVSAEAQGEMPVNFRATKNGTYTLTINPEGVEMNYLHLIDNMTGANIDLLQTPSYTFNASMNDYESRFKLVFAAGSSTGSEASETFAFFANGELIVNNEGEATLQVVDMTGRILSSQSLNGNGSVQMAAPVGVYVLRLISGNEVKTQKIVVR